jgi:hypothetical protein
VPVRIIMARAIKRAYEDKAFAIATSQNDPAPSRMSAPL